MKASTVVAVTCASVSVVCVLALAAVVVFVHTALHEVRVATEVNAYRLQTTQTESMQASDRSIAASGDARRVAMALESAIRETHPHLADALRTEFDLDRYAKRNTP